MVRTADAGPSAGRSGTGSTGWSGAGRWVIVGVVVVVVAGAGYLAYDRLIAAPMPAAPVQTVPVRRASIQSTVNSVGTVAPLAMAKLAFRSSGRVSEVNVRAGELGHRQ